MTLFLGGGGDIADSFAMDREFFKSLSADDRILYISSACDFTTYDNCLKWFFRLVRKYVEMPFENIVMCSEEPVIPELSEFKAIYIGGGNTYRLLDYVCRTGLKNKLIKYLDNGGLVFGGSAGAIIFGETAKTVSEEQEHYPDNNAVGYVKGYAVRCHYQESDDDEYKKLSKIIPFPILALPENGGIVYDDGKLNPVGLVMVYENGQKRLLK